MTAVGVALKEALSPQFVEYQKQVIANAKALCASLQKCGYTIVSGNISRYHQSSLVSIISNLFVYLASLGKASGENVEELFVI